MPDFWPECGNATLDDRAGRWHPAASAFPGRGMTDSLADLARQAPGLRLTTAPGDLEFYGRGWTPAPLAIAFPATIEEVRAIARWASAHRVALVPSGGRTGLSGGAVAANGELVVSFERMNLILDFNAIDRTLT